MAAIDFFPKNLTPREKQVKALDFVQRAYDKGIKDIVLALPTGTGKSWLGITLCQWAASITEDGATPGGYYLVNQKMLQDQLSIELERSNVNGVSLKSASEYSCIHTDPKTGSPKYANCALGQRGKCPCRKEGTCTYVEQKNKFLASSVSITNYSYFLTERLHVGRFPKRAVLVCDEVHFLENILVRHFDLNISESLLQEWTPRIKQVPVLKFSEFVKWSKDVYLDDADKRIKEMEFLADNGDVKFQKELEKLSQHVTKIRTAIENITKEPDNWIYWQEKDRNGQLESIVRPLHAANFMPTLAESGAVRIYMSAYPGTKQTFCRSVGLDPGKTAWLSVGSPFAVEKRPVILSMAGSMSMRNIDGTAPTFLRFVDKILTKHSNDRGIIHCNSYKIGQMIYDKLCSGPHGKRLLFPKKADERDECFLKHSSSNLPTVIISPSMTEGFDFVDNLARFQIIAKIPWPALGDARIVARKEEDEEWYLLQAVMTIIQAAGRIVRSNDDWGKTYILDSDFIRLYDNAQHLFPRWFTDAIIWPKSRSQQNQ